jgi:hypothetical protein
MRGEIQRLKTRTRIAESTRFALGISTPSVDPENFHLAEWELVRGFFSGELGELRLDIYFYDRRKPRCRVLRGFQ